MRTSHCKKNGVQNVKLLKGEEDGKIYRLDERPLCVIKEQSNMN